MTTLTTVNIATQKAGVAAELQALINGINTLLASVDPFILGNETIARADLLAKFQSLLNAANATKAAQTAYHNAVQSERSLTAEVAPLRAQMKLFLLSRFGKTSTQLQSFGFTPNKVPNKPVASKSTQVAKALATRKARGTLGKKQKSTIHGTVPAAPAPTPPVATTTTSTPSATTSPAASPAPSTNSTAARATSAPASGTGGNG
jgi:hypothetical protein